MLYIELLRNLAGGGSSDHVDPYPYLAKGGGSYYFDSSGYMHHAAYYLDAKEGAKFERQAETYAAVELIESHSTKGPGPGGWNAETYAAVELIESGGGSDYRVVVDPVKPAYSDGGGSYPQVKDVYVQHHALNGVLSRTSLHHAATSLRSGNFIGPGPGYTYKAPLAQQALPETGGGSVGAMGLVVLPSAGAVGGGSAFGLLTVGSLLLIGGGSTYHYVNKEIHHALYSTASYNALGPGPGNKLKTAIDALNVDKTKFERQGNKTRASLLVPKVDYGGGSPLVYISSVAYHHAAKQIYYTVSVDAVKNPGGGSKETAAAKFERQHMDS
nr:polytope fusion protein [synthetic construct]